MTQAFNLAQLANNLNTSGQLDATDGLNGLVANANLASSGTASSTTYLRGDRTWASLPGLGKILQVCFKEPRIYCAKSVRAEFLQPTFPSPGTDEHFRTTVLS